MISANYRSIIHAFSLRLNVISSKYLRKHIILSLRLNYVLS